MNNSKVFKIRLKKGDQVIVLSGRDKGKKGKVISVFPSLNKVTVEGINIYKKHVKPSSKYPQGGIIEVTKPLWVSKVAIFNSENNKASRISYKIGKDGQKSRVFSNTKKEISNG